MPRKAGSSMQIAKAVRSERKVGPRSGLVRLVAYVTPLQLGAVVEEAQRRARERGRMRSDGSGVVREALDAWMKARK